MGSFSHKGRVLRNSRYLADDPEFIEATKKMFDELEDADMYAKSIEFVDSLYEDYLNKGCLSMPQYRCLVRNYNKFVHNIPFEIEE